MIAAEGWPKTSHIPVLNLVRRFEDGGVAAVIFTDISRDGALEGVNHDATLALAEAVSIPVIAWWSCRYHGYKKTGRHSCSWCDYWSCYL